MFTGLVETTGKVISFESHGEQARLTLELPFLSELKLGESVAVNGCCLTVADLSEFVSFDLLAQTVRVTSLANLKEGSLVNVERAMRVGDRFGGHIVQGHVDARGTVTRIEESGQDHILGVSLPPEIAKFCVDKGSLTIDGISLTIATLTTDEATIWITPHTWENTHLHTVKTGQPVNLEADMLAKYVEKLLENRR